MTNHEYTEAIENLEIEESFFFEALSNVNNLPLPKEQHIGNLRAEIMHLERNMRNNVTS